jgi:hypothetical protein
MDDKHPDRRYLIDRMHGIRTLEVAVAMGWAYRGDIEKARHELAKFSSDELRWISAGASLVVTLADEVAEERGH